MWKEFSWAAFYFGIISGDIKGDSDYLALMGRNQFLQRLRTNPETIEVSNIREKIISDFLNRWKCRVINTEDAANEMRESLRRLVDHLYALRGLRIDIFQPEITVNVGAVILTSGFSPFDPTPFTHFGYPDIPDLVTGLEFERLLSANGPCMGHLVRPSDNQ